MGYLSFLCSRFVQFPGRLEGDCRIPDPVGFEVDYLPSYGMSRSGCLVVFVGLRWVGQLLPGGHND